MNIEFDRSCLKSAGQVSSTPASNEAERARALYVTKNARTRKRRGECFPNALVTPRARCLMVKVMPPPRVSAVGDASGKLVHLPSADGSVPAVVFSGGANPACVFVFLPGIMGNLDVPGVGEASCDLGLDRWASSSGRGSMFARLASELASGEDAPVAPWAPRDRRSAVHAKKARASSAATRETRVRRFRAACALVSWRASEDETAAGIAAGIAEGDDDDSVAARRLALAVDEERALVLVGALPL